MEDKPQDQTTVVPPVKPVMDVQPPVTPSAPATDSPAPIPAAAVVTPTEPVQASTPAPPPITPQELTPAVAPPDSPSPAGVEPDHPEPLVAEPTVDNIHHHKLPVVAIVIATVVALGLGTVAFLAYNNSKEEGTLNNSQTTQEGTPAVTTTDVDSTNKDIDDNINQLDENADFNESELSDDSLGL